MITFHEGNIFECVASDSYGIESGAITLVNPVNTVGVMGAGLALQFKQRYPDMFTRYQLACHVGRVAAGKIYPIIIPSGIVLCFPTKRHYKDPSQLDYIWDGLIDLVRVIHSYQINSIAIPALGCGLGDLQWSDVQPLIVAAMRPLSSTRVLLYPPH